MATIRADAVSGTVENTNGITDTDTTLESADLADLPVVGSGDIARITFATFDGVHVSAFEIAHVTDHTDGATTATISRGEEGTTEQSWANGTDWFHALNVQDIQDIVTDLSNHTSDTTNPHSVTVTQVGAVENLGATPSIQADTRANQPAAGTAGRLYHVTDEDVLERDNGTSWLQVLDLTHRNTTTNPHNVTAAQTGAVDDVGGVPSFEANTRANQPAAGTAGRLYYVTDEDVIERDDGAAWQQALDLTHRNDTTNPHGVTTTQIGAANDPHGNAEHSADFSPQSDVHVIVFHGTDSTVARPSGYAYVEWRGDAEPDNAQDDDIWVPANLDDQHIHLSQHPKRVDTAITYQIPTDFADLQTAIDSLANEIPDRGTLITLNIETGHTVASQLFVADATDASMFRITSDDATVTIQRDQLTQDLTGGGVYPAFGAIDRSTLPTIAVQFDMDLSGTATNRYGVYLWNQCSVMIEGGAGITTCGGGGLAVRENSKAYARNTDWSNSGQDGGNNSNGISSNGASIVYARGATCNDVVAAHGLRATAGSILNAFQTNASRCGRSNIRASLGSRVYANGGTFDDGGQSGAGHGAAATGNSMLAVDDSSITGATDNNIYATQGSVVNASTVTATGAGNDGVQADTGSVVNADSNSAFDSAGRYGIVAQHGSIVNANTATATQCGNSGVRSLYGSTVNAKGVDATEASSRGMRAVEGYINAEGANARTTIGSDGAADFDVANGSTIVANNATGGTSQTTNSITADGIIFQ